MPSGAEIQQYLHAAWRLMLGHEDGLRELDLSADGFWNSFYAMVVSVPALAVGWVTASNAANGPGSVLAERLSYVVRLAGIDAIAWVAPLLALALVARPAGIAHRFVPYVVASNWGSALLIWFMAPVSVIELVLPGASQLTALLALLVMIVSVGLAWRLTRASLGMGAGVASAVFFGTFVVSLGSLLALQAMFGLVPR